WDEAGRQRDEAEKNFQKSRRVVDRFVTQFSENELLNEPGLQPLRKQILEDALVHYKDFLRQRGNDPTIRLGLAATYLRLAIITSQIGSKAEALALCQQALQLQVELLRVHPGVRDYQSGLAVICTELGSLQTSNGQYGAALHSFQQARAIREDF